MRKIIRILSFILMLIGIGLFLYPKAQDIFFTYQQKKIIEEYNVKIKENIGTADNTISEKDNLYQQFLSDVIAYNKELTVANQTEKLSDKSLHQIPAINLTKYGIEDNIYGYIEIPKINVQMAIYLGASDYNLSKGATHLPFTSLPLGGKGTNSVISGHCGYGGIKMFRYISELSSGDEVNITTPFNKLTYRVLSTDVIKPTEINKLIIQPEKDLITLITCHPYPTNKYRFVVYCENIESEEIK